MSPLTLVWFLRIFLATDSQCWANGRHFNFCCQTDPSPCGADFFRTCCGSEISTRESAGAVLHVELTFEEMDEEEDLVLFRKDSWLAAFGQVSAASVIAKHAAHVDPELPDTRMHSGRFFSQLTLRLLLALSCTESLTTKENASLDDCSEILKAVWGHIAHVSLHVLMAVDWPLAEILDLLQMQLLSLLQADADEITSCFGAAMVDYSELWSVKDSVRSSHGGNLPSRLLLSPQLADVTPDEILSRGECPGGVFLATFMMAFITAQSEVGCVGGFTHFLEHHLRNSFVDFLITTAPWNMFAWVSRLGRQASRHRMQHGLAAFDLSMLGVRGFADLKCLTDSSTLETLPHWSMHFVTSFRSWTPASCRFHCHEFPFFSVSNVQCICLKLLPECSLTGDLRVSSVLDTRTRGLASLAMAFFSHPTAIHSRSIFKQIFDHINHSRINLTRVIATMVWGPLRNHLKEYAGQAELLGISEQIFLYALDEDTYADCIQFTKLRCISAFSEGKSAIQKYMIVLILLHFDLTVFWIDFDAVILRNPFENIPATFWSSSTEILTSIDHDSVDCAMNAMFVIKSSEKTITWLHALTKWIFSRPFFHCQHAWVMFLGLIEPFWADIVPAAPSWGVLDPNIYANGAAFDGLGFSGNVSNIAVFHFFYGWNSGAGRELAAIFMREDYKHLDMFSLLYSSDHREPIMNLSRVDPASRGQRRCGGVFTQSSSNLGLNAKCKPTMVALA